MKAKPGILFRYMFILHSFIIFLPNINSHMTTTRPRQATLLSRQSSRTGVSPSTSYLNLILRLYAESAFSTSSLPVLRDFAEHYALLGSTPLEVRALMPHLNNYLTMKQLPASNNRQISLLFYSLTLKSFL